jgi:hypothetical protein
MGTTPLWLPLVVAGLGVLGTICGTLAGVLLTQRRADARERLTWERQREEERRRWARDDALRTFEHRRDAYVDFYGALREMAFLAYNHGLGLSEPEELTEGWQLPTYRKLQHLQVYATEEVAEAASSAYSAAWYWGYRTEHGRDDDAFYQRQDEYDEKEGQLLVAIRKGLAVPESDVEAFVGLRDQPGSD